MAGILAPMTPMQPLPPPPPLPTGVVAGDAAEAGGSSAAR
eukprot:gene17718-19049_t